MPQRSPLFLALLAFVALLPVFFPTVAAAHDLRLTDTLLILRSDGTFQVDMTCDLDALALGAAPSTDSEELRLRLAALSPDELVEVEDRLRNLFLRRVRVLFDGQRSEVIVSFPERGTMFASEAEIPSFFGLIARLEGRVPEGAQEVAFRASRAFPPVHLTILHQRALAGERQLVEQGVPSDPFPVAGRASDEAPDRREVAGRYLILGFWHIVPEGLDHILFVLGLFLLSARLRPLLFQITAFTAAHAITLTLATLGWVTLSPAVVEPLIALSIVWVAVENIFTDELHPWRPALVFAFGLLHGLGFAGVLGELGLPRDELLTALVSFNVGIELGQLAVLVAAFALVGWARHKPGYRRWITIPASAVIAGIGMYWAVERIFF